jgi:predicted nucleotidyltransferase
MRLKPEIQQFIRENVKQYFPGTEVYLFGSRTNDHAAGGDIDLLLISDQKIGQKKLRRFRVDFYRRFGWQKIDLINFTKEEPSTFKKLIEKEAVPILQ